jgi:D-sedoheptulose 7-phosphate isomerase
MTQEIKNIISNSIQVKQLILEDDVLLKKIEEVVELSVNALTNGNRLWFCGNGGSFADAQHLSAELSGRFYFDRDPLEVVLLAANVSYLTAVGNDYSYSDIFSREIKSSVKEGDILICFSTSGKSKNVIKAIGVAKNKGAIIASFIGNDGGEMKDISDYNLIIPSNNTARIQECHTLLGHTILEIVENKMFK